MTEGTMKRPVTLLVTCVTLLYTATGSQLSDEIQSSLSVETRQSEPIEVLCSQIDTQNCVLVVQSECSAMCGEGTFSMTYDCAGTQYNCYQSCRGLYCDPRCYNTTYTSCPSEAQPCSRQCGVGNFMIQYNCDSEVISCQGFCCCKPCDGNSGIIRQYRCDDFPKLDAGIFEQVCPS